MHRISADTLLNVILSHFRQPFSCISLAQSYLVLAMHARQELADKKKLECYQREASAMYERIILLHHSTLEWVCIRFGYLLRICAKHYPSPSDFSDEKKQQFAVIMLKAASLMRNSEHLNKYTTFRMNSMDMREGLTAVYEKLHAKRITAKDDVFDASKRVIKITYDVLFQRKHPKTNGPMEAKNVDQFVSMLKETKVLINNGGLWVLRIHVRWTKLELSTLILVLCLTEWTAWTSIWCICFEKTSTTRKRAN